MDEVCRAGTVRGLGGGECGVCYKGHNEGMGRDFKKEKHEAPHTSFLDNGAAE